MLLHFGQNETIRRFYFMILQTQLINYSIMKKILLSLCVIFGLQTNAQTCTPDTANPSLASIGYPSLEWSGMWVNGETPSFACDSTQPMMNLEAVVGQPFEATNRYAWRYLPIRRTSRSYNTGFIFIHYGNPFVADMGCSGFYFLSRYGQQNVC